MSEDNLLHLYQRDRQLCYTLNGNIHTETPAIDEKEFLANINRGLNCNFSKFKPVNGPPKVFKGQDGVNSIGPDLYSRVIEAYKQHRK